MLVTVMGVKMLISDLDTVLDASGYELVFFFQTPVGFKVRIGIKFLYRGTEAAL